MSIAALILGLSGTGKSTSLRNFNPADVLLIQALRKPLPFKSSEWKPYDKSTGKGSVIVTDNPVHIEGAMRKIQRPVVVIDDFQAVMTNEFMRRSDEKGFDKFNDIGRHIWDLLNAATGMADHRRVYIMAHTATDESGLTRMKSVGKMVDDKITPEGMVTICLRTVVRDGQYFFSTQTNGSDPVKSPIGMFEEPLVNNDLAEVDAAITSYYEITTASC